MIIVCISGGLGNQLQQYALYRSFLSQGIDAKVDISWFGDDVQKTVAAKRKLELNRLIGINYDICTREEKERFIGRGILGNICRKLDINRGRIYTEHELYDPNLLKYTDMYVEGSFVCDQYYIDVLPELRKEMDFPIEECHNRDQLLKIASDMEQQYSISIHIRRGDYLDDINKPIYGNICTKAYYASALDYCLNGINKAKIYVFSDDHEYAEVFASKLVDEHARISDCEVVGINSGSDSLFDMFLMSLCDCNITANSTFSYWGARLNNKSNAIRIRPIRHKNTLPFSSEDKQKLWSEWTLVDSKGNIY